jgi:hypothetical protein
VLQRADKTSPHRGPETMHQLCNIAADPVETATYGPELIDRWTEAKQARIAHIESTESAMEYSIHKWQRLQLSRCRKCSYKTRLCIVTDQGWFSIDSERFSNQACDNESPWSHSWFQCTSKDERRHDNHSLNGWSQRVVGAHIPQLNPIPSMLPANILIYESDSKPPYLHRGTS